MWDSQESETIPCSYGACHHSGWLSLARWSEERGADLGAKRKEKLVPSGEAGRIGIGGEKDLGAGP